MKSAGDYSTSLAEIRHGWIPRLFSLHFNSFEEHFLLQKSIAYSESNPRNLNESIVGLYVAEMHQKVVFI